MTFFDKAKDMANELADKAAPLRDKATEVVNDLAEKAEPLPPRVEAWRLSAALPAAPAVKRTAAVKRTRWPRSRSTSSSWATSALAPSGVRPTSTRSLV